MIVTFQSPFIPKEEPPVFANPTMSFDLDAQTVMTIHRMSMSDKPLLASQGRLLKEFLPIYMKWVKAEEEREIPGSFVCGAFSLAMSTLLSYMLQQLIPPAIREESVSELMDIMKAQVLEMTKEIGKVGK
jgi:hypothetical protein